MNANELTAIIAALGTIEPPELAAALDAAIAPFRARQNAEEFRLAEERTAAKILTRGQVGLAKGWVSSLMFQRALVNYEVPWTPKRAAEFLQSLGYVKHPGLRNGRTNNRVLPDATKPTLFVKPDHYSVAFTRPCDIERAYRRDQGYGFTT